MAIPAISPYPMPGESDLPRNQASWRLDPARAALLIHDMQRYFVDFFTPGEPPVTDLIDNICMLRECARKSGVPVIYTAQPGGMTREQRGLLRDFWGPGMSTDPLVKGMPQPLTPVAGEKVMKKWRYSAFHRTGLRRYLAKYRRDQLIICGVYAHIGCLITACDAFAADIQPFLVADALADFSAEDHHMALAYAAKRCGMIVTVKNLTAALGSSSLIQAAVGR
jgi:trans-2,3-dihydro-3-hydroxyanthranilic acid synthase